MSPMNTICKKNEAEKYRRGINRNIQIRIHRSNRAVAIILMMSALKMEQPNIGCMQKTSKRKKKAKASMKRK